MRGCLVPSLPRERITRDGRKLPLGLNLPARACRHIFKGDEPFRIPVERANELLGQAMLRFTSLPANWGELGLLYPARIRHTLGLGLSGAPHRLPDQRRVPSRCRTERGRTRRTNAGASSGGGERLRKLRSAQARAAHQAYRATGAGASGTHLFSPAADAARLWHAVRTARWY